MALYHPGGMQAFLESQGVKLTRWKLCVLDRLEEPESLCSLRERVAALLPPVDLPDVIAEVAAWTGFAEEFTHVSEAGARVDDLTASVCAVLVAEAANVGLGPVRRRPVLAG